MINIKELFKHWKKCGIIAFFYFLFIIILVSVKFSSVRLIRGVLLAILLSLIGGMLLSIFVWILLSFKNKKKEVIDWIFFIIVLLSGIFIISFLFLIFTIALRLILTGW